MFPLLFPMICPSHEVPPSQPDPQNFAWPWPPVHQAGENRFGLFHVADNLAAFKRFAMKRCSINTYPAKFEIWAVVDPCTSPNLQNVWATSPKRLWPTSVSPASQRDRTLEWISAGKTLGFCGRCWTWKFVVKLLRQKDPFVDVWNNDLLPPQKSTLYIDGPWIHDRIPRVDHEAEAMCPMYSTHQWNTVYPQ